MSRNVEAVREYALAHYDETAWSWVVEAMDDHDIAREVRGATSERMAIYKMSLWVKLYHEYGEEIRNA